MLFHTTYHLPLNFPKILKMFQILLLSKTTVKVSQNMNKMIYNFPSHWDVTAKKKTLLNASRFATLIRKYEKF